MTQMYTDTNLYDFKRIHYDIFMQSSYKIKRIWHTSVLISVFHTFFSTFLAGKNQIQ